MNPQELEGLQAEAGTVHTAPALLDYVQALIAHTRSSPEFSTGLSPRAALALLHAARAWALMDNRRHTVPEDVQAVLAAVVGHRLVPAHEDGMRGNELAAHLIKQVAIP